MKKFLVLLLIFAISCKKEQPAPTPGSADPQNFSSFGLTINNHSFSYNTDDTDVVSNALAIKDIHSPPQMSSGLYQSYITTTGSMPALVVNRGRLLFPDTIPSNTAFLSLFTIGDHSFSISANDGFEVDWIDPQGNIWSTSEMNGYQGNNKFRIIAANHFYENGVYCVKVFAVFSCTLYRPTGESEPLTACNCEMIFKNL
jgi:hypothetical protein